MRMDALDELNRVAIGERTPSGSYDEVRVKVTKSRRIWLEYLAMFLVLFFFIGIGIVIGYLLRG